MLLTPYGGSAIAVSSHNGGVIYAPAPVLVPSGDAGSAYIYGTVPSQEYSDQASLVQPAALYYTTGGHV